MDDLEPNDGAGLFRDFHVDNSLAAALLDAVFLDDGTFAVAFLGDGEDLVLGLYRVHADDFVHVAQANAVNAPRLPPHDPDIGFFKDDGEAVAGTDDDLPLAVRRLDADQIVVLVKRQSDQTALARRVKFLQHRLFHDALARRHKEIAILPKGVDGNDGGDCLAAGERQQVDDRRALRLPRRLRNIVAFEPVNKTAVREEKDGLVRRRNEELLDKIRLLRPHAGHAASPALLVAVSVEGNALDVAAVGQRQHDVFFRDEVFHRHIRGVEGDPSAAVVAELLFDLRQLVLDNAKDFALVGEDGFQVLDGFQHFLIFFLNFFPLEAGQALEPEIEDRLRLLFRESEAVHEGGAGNIGGARLPDRLYDRVEMVKGDGQAF